MMALFKIMSHRLIFIIMLLMYVHNFVVPRKDIYWMRELVRGAAIPHNFFPNLYVQPDVAEQSGCLCTNPKQ